MVALLILVLFYILTPLLINYLCFRYDLLRKIGAVVIAYAIGLIIGNSGLMPEASEAMIGLITNKQLVLTEKYINQLFSEGKLTAGDLQYFRVYHIQDLITTLTIAIALPLLLFSLNVKSWFKVAGKTFLSLVLGLVSVIIPIVAGYFIFRNDIDEAWKVAGMMTGVYSGGTPNLASLQKALDVDTLTYILTHSYDLVIGAVFLFFVMTVAQRLFHYILPKYEKADAELAEVELQYSYERSRDFWEPVRKNTLIPNLAAIALTLLIVGISAGLGELFSKELQMMITILGITSLSILASLIPSVNRLKKTFDYGMYFILIFSLVIASMADLRYFTTSHINLFYWVAFVYLGSLAIHVGLAALFRIDADNVIIVSTALSCSPPFVPVVAGALNNKEVIISGLTVGIIGYAIGNYLGILMAQVLYYY